MRRTAGTSQPCDGLEPSTPSLPWSAASGCNRRRQFARSFAAVGASTFAFLCGRFRTADKCSMPAGGGQWSITDMFASLWRLPVAGRGCRAARSARRSARCRRLRCSPRRERRAWCPGLGRCRRLVQGARPALVDQTQARLDRFLRRLGQTELCEQLAAANAETGRRPAGLAMREQDAVHALLQARAMPDEMQPPAGPLALGAHQRVR
jgi:hypothetical protein